MEQLWHVKQFQLFERLSESQLARLEQGAKIRKFSRGAVVYLPQDAASHVFLLAEGRIKLCHCTPDGKEAILAFIDPGELFGELALTTSDRREERAEAVEASTVVLLDTGRLESTMSEDAGLTLGITRLIGLRRQRVERRLKSLLFRSNRERMTDLLQELAERYGRTIPSGIEITLRLTHQELANVIGATRETVTLVLGELQLEGLISVGRKKIVITQPGRLFNSPGTAAEAAGAVRSGTLGAKAGQ
jgi:CRP/FNR family transcriptional regulator, cyclic AMP receptor protein